MPRSSLIFLLLLAILVVAPGTTMATQSPTPGQRQHFAPSLLPFRLAPHALLPAPAVYDEQIGISYAQDFGSLAYNVTAVSQTDADGYGPAYLLNGLTDAGYWYQIGISYDWPFANGGYQQGFAMNFEVFDTSQNSIFPTSGGGGLDNFTGPVHSGDVVLLTLSFTGGDVVMSARDQNTGTHGQEVFAAHGSRFVGTQLASDPNGYFTGLMTEWYHVNAYFGSQGEVTYSGKSPVTSGVMWADEFNSNTMAPVFTGSLNVTFTNPAQLLSFSSNGATAYADAHSFITGSLNTAVITLSFAVSGGGSGYAAPALSYTLEGTARTAKLTQSPTSYFADFGTRWQVNSSLAGGTPNERWQTDQQTAGTANSMVSVSMVYFHQYLHAFEYSVSGGGTTYVPPQVSSVRFGAAVTEVGNKSGWADAGVTATFPSTLVGSTSTERWHSQSPGQIVSGPGGDAVIYYHQFALSFSYLLAGGGTPQPPQVNSSQSASSFSFAISNGTSYFLDSGARWQASTLLPGSGSGERWSASVTADGTVSGAQVVDLVYRHQFMLTVALSPAAGGTTAASSGWQNAGTTIVLSQTAAPGWKFEGWTGNGTGSYSGPSNSTSLMVSSPLVETATFYPALTISAQSGGSVSYAYGSHQGSVPGGGSLTVYVPRGTAVLLRESPSTLYSVAGWSIGVSHSSSADTTVDLQGPTTASAAFSLNLVLIGGSAAGLAVVAAAVVLILRARNRSRVG